MTETNIKQDIVQKFYNETPFPDYEWERFNSKEDLEPYAQPFSKILDRSIPADASIIDIGTGTGMLSAYLSLRRKKVWGVDFSDSSLKKAIGLKEKLKLDTLTLRKVDILDLEQVQSVSEKFDYLLSTGVLHHTTDPYRGFQNILHLVKPNGYIAIGLYNKPGRSLLKIRIFLAKTVYKNNDRVKDWFIRMILRSCNHRLQLRPRAINAIFSLSVVCVGVMVAGAGFS